MKRRQFIKYTSLGVASCGITACTQGNLDVFRPQGTLANPDKAFGPLEKTNLTLGFMATTDAAPLIIAQEKGFFERYGLIVTLKRQPSWEAIENDLLEWRLDAAQTPFTLPMEVQLGKKQAPLIALMNLNLNGSAITITQKAWKKGVRPSIDYNNFSDFERGFRQYIRNHNQSVRWGIDSPVSMDAYLLRYWLSAMGIDPDREIELLEFPAAQLNYKLQAGMLEGYIASAPWTQTALSEEAGFISYISRDIWQGHPNKILAAMDGWVRKNPATARALMAALLEACQYCDRQGRAFSDRHRSQTEIPELLAQPQYLNLDSSLIKSTLGGTYLYSNEESTKTVVEIPDFIIFNYQDTPYLQTPDHANYPWRSHAIWLLTQMIRWNKNDLKTYPKDADKLLDKIYPISLYEEVAKTLNIPIPNDTLKTEKATAFIDGRSFDPSEPVAYLNQFSIRASRPQIVSFV
ncbi:nitrate transport protein, NrtC like protein [Rippkaea orientalis PCC 8801]|uniref:Nitrate transport protein, NrtC like protein n=1 Tax=Rippkaea orientalis (strain PCC 8801 / RF-1) TaxID=41431 RepID=B7JVG2_RIPO1|nr:CmpA/NrtA family ABC transporter substrate-binding protein [Rippkaea orientalis]ACK68295.1 nitrate transport protein, NrtC like protein [Rippkaea orientalis PCC 8801]